MVNIENGSSCFDQTPEEAFDSFLEVLNAWLQVLEMNLNLFTRFVHLQGGIHI
ncbi:unnamed protein product [Linum tenue]|uniref:Uncharacterized protein n=1 Tax=Linum tenue TaxID=586396 RepID=A0AAV0PE16_9ROSI|nr:unnamed protein product [Linum tenue]